MTCIVSAVERNNGVEVRRCLFQPGDFSETLAGSESAVVGHTDKWETANGNLMYEPIKVATPFSGDVAAINGVLQLQGTTTSTFAPRIDRVFVVANQVI